MADSAGTALSALHWSVRMRSITPHLCGLGPAMLTVVWLRRAGIETLTGWLCGWVIYCLIVLALFWLLATRLDAVQTAHRAKIDDPGGFMLFLLVILACCASLFAVLMAVQAGHALRGAGRWAHLALVGTSLALSWLLMHAAYALHYARVYYQARVDREPAAHAERGRRGKSASTRLPVDGGGLSFPGGQAPDYPDFFYFSAVIGMTSQVSDVQITGRRMRRLATGHGMLAFAFNLVILALGVNVLASSLA